MSNESLMPVWCEPLDMDRPAGWRIGGYDEVGQFHFTREGRDLLFARKCDVEYALRALADSGITMASHMLPLNDSDWVPIALSGLMW